MLSVSSPSCWDHPRGCGAHDTKRNVTLSSKGSSPRVRGSPCVDIDDALLRGIIPAGAGLTQSISHTRRGCKDHPRGCGAHDWLRMATCRTSGSSPRVRGSRIRDGRADRRLGIIPAGAGLTAVSARTTLSTWDHPRGCGAHCSSSSSIAVCLGSSPRVRGSHGLWLTIDRKHGIIPAGAGLTSYSPPALRA